MTITASELRALGLAVWGHEWQSPLARALKISPRTVRRWASGDTSIPDGVEAQIRRVMGADENAAGVWPRDEWIVQREGGARCYIVHTLAPRFIARAVEVDEDGEPLEYERPADVISGVVYADDDMVLCEIAWIDAPPGAKELARLMDQAAGALEIDHV